MLCVDFKKLNGIATAPLLQATRWENTPVRVNKLHTTTPHQPSGVGCKGGARDSFEAEDRSSVPTTDQDDSAPPNPEQAAGWIFFINEAGLEQALKIDAGLSLPWSARLWKWIKQALTSRCALMKPSRGS